MKNGDIFFYRAAEERIDVGIVVDYQDDDHLIKTYWNNGNGTIELYTESQLLRWHAFALKEIERMSSLRELKNDR